MQSDQFTKVKAAARSGKDVMVICDSQHHAQQAALHFFNRMGKGVKLQKYLRCVEIGKAVVQFTWPNLSDQRRPSEYDEVYVGFKVLNSEGVDVETVEQSV